SGSLDGWTVEDPPHRSVVRCAMRVLRRSCVSAREDGSARYEQRAHADIDGAEGLPHRSPSPRRSLAPIDDYLKGPRRNSAMAAHFFEGHRRRRGTASPLPLSSRFLAPIDDYLQRAASQSRDGGLSLFEASGLQFFSVRSVFSERSDFSDL